MDIAIRRLSFEAVPKSLPMLFTHIYWFADATHHYIYSTYRLFTWVRNVNSCIYWVIKRYTRHDIFILRSHYTYSMTMVMSYAVIPVRVNVLYERPFLFCFKSPRDFCDVCIQYLTDSIICMLAINNWRLDLYYISR